MLGSGLGALRAKCPARKALDLLWHRRTGRRPAQSDQRKPLEKTRSLTVASVAERAWEVGEGATDAVVEAQKASGPLVLVPATCSPLAPKDERGEAAGRWSAPPPMVEATLVRPGETQGP